MKYHFEHDFTHARMLVITLDKGDLQSMWADNVNAHVKLHQEIRVWALKSAPP